MATLWTFGDSLTEQFNPELEWSNSYIKWKGYMPKVYGNFVSEMLNYDLQNLGKAGSDNYTIFETFCKTYPNIQDGDVVIIGWTSPVRFRLVDKKGEWKPLVPSFENFLPIFDGISQNTINEILINRDHAKYVDEVNNWIGFINSACVNKKIVQWDTIKGEGELNTYHFFEMEKIRTETNGEVNDSHFSENGHREMSKELLQIILNKDGVTNTRKLI
jgi:hypothetical protein